ncbi:hypothetical protein QBC34DRAFT_494843 [Podospora aff. communis PSN243]|uniref:Uncharacterized protein n=1 Tax=Podospora aff. communis PSN243 TaxID=3040156 RepID=A0AAV9GKP3_9PEZI|nr:hypothetical protein QBC34DRAFT_494843 [Podospora aff. communis PSN243]
MPRTQLLWCGLLSSAMVGFLQLVPVWNPYIRAKFELLTPRYQNIADPNPFSANATNYNRQYLPGGSLQSIRKSGSRRKAQHPYQVPECKPLESSRSISDTLPPLAKPLQHCHHLLPATPQRARHATIPQRGKLSASPTRAKIPTLFVTLRIGGINASPIPLFPPQKVCIMIYRVFPILPQLS